MLSGILHLTAHSFFIFAKSFVFLIFPKHITWTMIWLRKIFVAFALPLLCSLVTIRKYTGTFLCLYVQTNLPTAQSCARVHTYTHTHTHTLSNNHLLTKSEQYMCQFCKQHLAVLSFVVQLHTFQEVLIASYILILLDLSEDGQEIFNLQLLLIYNSKLRLPHISPKIFGQKRQNFTLAVVCFYYEHYIWSDFFGKCSYW